MPLRDELKQVGERIISHFDLGGEPPFIVYQYPPHQEWPVRRDLGELRRWLEAEPRRVSCVAVSLARLFWQALEDSGFIDELIAQEQQSMANPAALRQVYDAVGEILRESPTLPQRVIDEVKDCDERTAVFLYRAGAAIPGLPHLDSARRPSRPSRSPGDPALPRPPSRRVRPQLHGPHGARLRVPGTHRSQGGTRVKIDELFRRDIHRKIEEVVKVDLDDESVLASELDEYVATRHILEEFEKVVDAYQESINSPNESCTVWVSGFFGSGKSSWAKVFGYLLSNPIVAGKSVADWFFERADAPRLRALLATIHAQAPTSRSC